MTIGFQFTPGKPIEIEFGVDAGLANDQQELLLIGRAATGTTGTETVITISNVNDLSLATTEANTKFGAGSEMAKMVIAAVEANTAQARSTFPPIKCCPLANTATEITTAAQTAIKKVKAEFIASPFDGLSDTVNRGTLVDMVAEMSGAQRVENNQFGSMGVVANLSESDASNLDSPDSQYLIPIWYHDESSDARTVGEVAAAAAAVLAQNLSPFNPVDKVVIGGLEGQDESDKITVSSGGDSETALVAGWTPLYTKPNGDVAFVRSRTSRITNSAGAQVTSYIDVQDFQVLYLWRKTVYTRFSQVDFSNVKASAEKARAAKSELVRLAEAFETAEMFKSVAELAKQFTVTTNAGDRHRFDYTTPVNVVPGLHVLAGTVQATTLFDTITV